MSDDPGQALVSAAGPAAAVRGRGHTLFDAALAVILAGYGFAAGLTSSEYPNPGPRTAVLVGAAGLALAARRTRPTLALLTTLGLLGLACALDGSYQAGSSLLIALVACYSAAAYGTQTWILAAAILVFAGAMTPGRPPETLGGIAFVALVTGLAAAGGRLAQRLRATAAANAALRELVQLTSSATTRAAVDEERARVARELHDILSHSLGLVVLQTSAAEHAWGTDPARAHEAVRAARTTAVEAVDQLRTLLAVVRDDPSAERTPVPTIDDLQSLAERSTEAGFRVQLSVEGTPRPVPAALQASVFRVAQEGIANAMKHSGQAACHLRLQYLPDVVVVTVHDDGQPRTSPSPRGSQLGLAGIRERAALFGGRLDAGPGPGGGWLLRAEFPG